MTETVKQIHLAAHSPGGNNTTVWGDPQSGSHIDFKSFFIWLRPRTASASEPLRHHLARGSIADRAR